MIASIARSVCRVVYILTGVCLILIAVFLIAARVGLPLLASQKSAIEARISQHVQSPVQIGDLSLRWRGYAPLIRVSDVSLIESENRVVSFDEVLVDIDLPASISRREPIINELSMAGSDLLIESEDIALLRGRGVKQAAGDSPVSQPTGSKDDDNTSNGINVLAWLANTRKLALVDTRLTLVGSENDQELIFDDIDISAQKQGDTHRIRLNASLPTMIGGSLTAGIDLVAQSEELAASDGNLHFSVTDIDWSGLNQALSQSGLPSIRELAGDSLPIVNATANLELWGRWEKGEIVALRGPLSVTDLSHRSGEYEQINSISADIDYLRSDTIAQLVVADTKIRQESRELIFNEIRLSNTDDELIAEASAVELSEATTGTSLNETPDVRPGVVSELSSETVQPENSDAADKVTTTGMRTMDTTTIAGSVNPVAQFLLGSTNSELPWQLTATADELSVDAIAQMVNSGLLPLSNELLDTVSGSQSQGFINNVQIAVKDIELNAAADAKVTASADINAVAFAAQDNTLAFGPVSGSFTLNDNIAHMHIRASDMPLKVAEFTDRALNADLINAITTIDFNRPEETRVTSEVSLDDDGIETNTRISAMFTSGKSPHLDIQSRFSVDDLEAIKPWLPRNLLSADAESWLDRSIKSGRATQGSLVYFGHTSDFPFAEGEGVFNASVELSDGVVQFLPSWPEMRNVNGLLEFDGLSLTGEATGSAFEKFSLSRTRLGIANITAPVLTVSTTGSGVFDDVVDFGIYGPLSATLEPVVRDMSGTGSTELDLELVVPLYEKPAEDAVGLHARTWQPFSFDGSLFLNDNDVTFDRLGLTLTDARGGVAFSQQGLFISALKGRLLDHDVTITGNTQGDGENATTTINVTGAMQANELLAHYDNTLDQFISGTSTWNFSVTAPHSVARIASEGVGLSVTSDLLGTNLLLPVPLRKSSALEREFKLATSFKGDENQQWQVSYGDEFRTFVSFNEQSLYSIIIELGDMRFAERQQVLNEPGIHIEGKTEQLAADSWIQTLTTYIKSLSSASGDPQLILPVSGALSTDALILGNTNFGKGSFRASTGDSYLDIVISNQSLIGNLRYPRAHWKKDLAMLARIELLDWSIIEALGAAGADDSTDELSSDKGQSLDPRLLPPVEASVASLTRDDFHVQDLVLRAEPDVSGLDITTFGFAYDTMRLVGQGYWHLRDPQGVNPSLAGEHITQLDFVLQSNDFGAGLGQLGLGGVIDGGQGSVEMKLGWPAPIYLPHLAELDGEITIDLQSGSIVPVEPGAGRVVGLFAFQALPRRLDLDFEDLTGDGLAFRRIVGSIEITQGIAQVPLLQLAGPIGVIDLVGLSDLTTQKFDQVVTVLPRVSAALPIIGAITGGASGGIGAFVATGFLKALGVDFDRIGLRTYSLTGDWRSPQFAPIASDFLRRNQ